jgi:LysR family nitrogen assimilation transcriptional regulator
LDLKQMRYFEAVVRHKSFSQAALKLFIAQPALGFQVRKLEEELGVQLLIRNTRGVEPTEAGLLFLEKAKKILGEVELAKREMADLSGPLRGRISIGITPTIASILALPLLERCRKDLPMVTINLVEDLGSVMTEWLLLDRLDMALAFSVPPTLGLSAKTLVEDHAYFICKAEPGAQTMKPISFEEITSHPLILASSPNRLRQFVEDEARARKLELNVCLEVQAPATILNLVENGFGSTVMSIVAVRPLLGKGLLSARPIVDPEISYPLSLVRSDSNPLSNAEAALQEIIEELVTAIVIKGGTPQGNRI